MIYSTAANNIIGTNNERNFTPVRYWRFYLNTADPAPCNGTINSWRYWFYNPGSINKLNGHEYKTTLQFTEKLVQIIKKSCQVKLQFHGVEGICIDHKISIATVSVLMVS